MFLSELSLTSDTSRYRGMVRNSQSGTSYTLVLTDAGKWVSTDNASAIALTVPANASVAFPTSTIIVVSNLGAGVCTITPDGGVTINGPYLRLRENQEGLLRKVDTNEWIFDLLGGPTPLLQNSQSADYTLVMSDAFKQILHPLADTNNRTFTIPANASVAYSIGTMVTFVNEVNTVTIAITSDTLILAGDGSTGSRTLAADGMATALKIGSTRWMISGAGLT